MGSLSRLHHQLLSLLMWLHNKAQQYAPIGAGHSLRSRRCARRYCAGANSQPEVQWLNEVQEWLRVDLVRFRFNSQNQLQMAPPTS